MSRLTPLLRRIPRHVLITFAVIAASQVLAYCGTNLLNPYLTPHVLTGPLDDRIPFSPPWVTVYCLCFPYWIVCGYLILRSSKTYAYRFTAAYVISMAISAAFFVLWPGTLARPEITGKGFFDWWMRIVYAVDGPTNLCPSLHVMVTYYCFRGAWECGQFSRRSLVAFFVFFVLVCGSVVLVKQHALIDIPCGILVGELSLTLARLLRLERIGLRLETNWRNRKKE